MKTNQNDPRLHIPPTATPPRFSTVSPLSMPGAPLADALYVDALYAGALDAGIGSMSTYPNIISDSLRAVRQEQETERRAEAEKENNRAD